MNVVLFGILIGFGVNLERFYLWRVVHARSCLVQSLWYRGFILMELSACWFGVLTAGRISRVVSPSIATLMGCSILVASGVCNVMTSFLDHNEGFDAIPQLDFSGMMTITLSRALATLTIGLGVGFVHVNIQALLGSMAMFGVLSCFVPFPHRRTQKQMRRWSTEVQSGVLFIMVGLVILFL